MKSLAINLTTAKFVACHGDPHPGNIIIQDNQWYWVDFEWVGGNHDWRMMLAHILGWWDCHFSNISFLEFSDTKKSTIISIKSYLPDHIVELKALARNLFLTMSENHEEDFYTINIYLMLLFLGHIRFLPKHHYQENRSFFLSLAAEYALKAKQHLSPNHLFSY